MDAKHWLLIIVVIVLLGAGALMADSWFAAHEAQVTLAATVEAQNSVIAAADRREQDRTEQLRNTLQQIENLKRAVQTPQQVIQAIPQYRRSCRCPSASNRRRPSLANLSRRRW
jgi:hypothetical protein